LRQFLPQIFQSKSINEAYGGLILSPAYFTDVYKSKEIVYFFAYMNGRITGYDPGIVRSFLDLWMLYSEGKEFFLSTLKVFTRIFTKRFRFLTRRS
jgi:hypothetical protein